MGVFRSNDVSQAIYIIKTIFSSSLFENVQRILNYSPCCYASLLGKWLNRNYEFGLGLFKIKPRIIRFLIYYCFNSFNFSICRQIDFYLFSVLMKKFIIYLSIFFAPFPNTYSIRS